jgi:methionyl-tRNA synthetase
MDYFVATMGSFFTFFILIIVAWDMIWKGIGMWKAGRHNQLGWFIAMFVLNTLGILPIIYLLFFQKKRSDK